MVRVQPHPSTLESACKVKTATLDMLEGADTKLPSVSKASDVPLSVQVSYLDLGTSYYTSTLPQHQHRSALSVLRIKCTPVVRPGSALGPKTSLHPRYGVTRTSWLQGAIVLNFHLCVPFEEHGIGRLPPTSAFSIAFRIYSDSLKSQQSVTQQLLTTPKPRHGRTTRAGASSACPPLSKLIRE